MRLKICENLKTANLSTKFYVDLQHKSTQNLNKKSIAFYCNHRIRVIAVNFSYPKRWIINNLLRNPHALILLLYHH